MVNVQLVYSNKDKQLFQLELGLTEGATVADALQISGILQQYPEIEELSCGIFAKAVEKNHVLKQGDRLEIYRPLNLDPMEKRRLRAKKKPK